MRNVVAAHWAHLVGRDGGDGNRVAIERAELDLKGFTIPMDVNDGPHVPGTQFLVGKIATKNDAVVFVDRSVVHEPFGKW